MSVRPYSDGPLPPGVVARVEMARTAMMWLADIRAYLVEQELTTELAVTVAGLMDLGYSMEGAVALLRRVMDADWPTVTP